jgi:hypothetical protein
LGSILVDREVLIIVKIRRPLRTRPMKVEKKSRIQKISRNSGILVLEMECKLKMRLEIGYELKTKLEF